MLTIQFRIGYIHIDIKTALFFDEILCIIGHNLHFAFKARKNFIKTIVWQRVIKGSNRFQNLPFNCLFDNARLKIFEIFI